MNRFSERDWKLFCSKIAGWQEAYMDKLNKEYMAILSGKGNASEKFWKLEKRIKEDKKDCGVQCEMSRSNQFYIMLELLNEGAITINDLEDFSEDLKETMKHFSIDKNRRYVNMRDPIENISQLQKKLNDLQLENQILKNILDKAGLSYHKELSEFRQKDCKEAYDLEQGKELFIRR